MVSQIAEAAKQLKSVQGRPKRVTAGAIRTRLRKILSRRQIDQMPRVADTLALVTESDEMLALRRVEWALGEAAGRRDMTRSKFVKFAGIKATRECPKLYQRSARPSAIVIFLERRSSCGVRFAFTKLYCQAETAEDLILPRFIVGRKR